MYTYHSARPRRRVCIMLSVFIFVSSMHIPKMAAYLNFFNGFEYPGCAILDPRDAVQTKEMSAAASRVLRDRVGVGINSVCVEMRWQWGRFVCTEERRGKVAWILDGDGWRWSNLKRTNHGPKPKSGTCRASLSASGRGPWNLESFRCAKNFWRYLVR